MSLQDTGIEACCSICPIISRAGPGAKVHRRACIIHHYFIDNEDTIRDSVENLELPKVDMDLSKAELSDDEGGSNPAKQRSTPETLRAQLQHVLKLYLSKHKQFKKLQKAAEALITGQEKELEELKDSNTILKNERSDYATRVKELELQLAASGDPDSDAEDRPELTEEQVEAMEERVRQIGYRRERIEKLEGALAMETNKRRELEVSLTAEVRNASELQSLFEAEARNRREIEGLLEVEARKRRLLEASLAAAERRRLELQGLLEAEAWKRGKLDNSLHKEPRTRQNPEPSRLPPQERRSCNILPVDRDASEMDPTLDWLEAHVKMTEILRFAEHDDDAMSEDEDRNFLRPCTESLRQLSVSIDLMLSRHARPEIDRRHHARVSGDHANEGSTSSRQASSSAAGVQQIGPSTIPFLPPPRDYDQEMYIDQDIHLDWYDIHNKMRHVLLLDVGSDDKMRGNNSRRGGNWSMSALRELAEYTQFMYEKYRNAALERRLQKERSTSTRFFSPNSASPAKRKRT